jgi:hypothetical protein
MKGGQFSWQSPWGVPLTLVFSEGYPQRASEIYFREGFWSLKSEGWLGAESRARTAGMEKAILFHCFFHRLSS